MGRADTSPAYSSMGNGGLPFPLSLQKRARALQAWCSLVLTTHLDNHHSFYTEEQKQGENSIEFLSIFSWEGWNLVSISHFMVWCKNKVRRTESMSTWMLLAVSNRNLNPNGCEHYENMWVQMWKNSEVGGLHDWSAQQLKILVRSAVSSVLREVLPWLLYTCQ